MITITRITKIDARAFTLALLMLAFGAAAGCSTADDLMADGTSGFPNMNTQAVARPEGLLSPQEKQAQIDAMNTLAAQHAATATQEIEAKK